MRPSATPRCPICGKVIQRDEAGRLIARIKASDRGVVQWHHYECEAAPPPEPPPTIRIGGDW